VSRGVTAISGLRLQAGIFLVAVLLNLIWEVAQVQLYAFPRRGILIDLVGCLVPSLGDGLMTLAIYWSGWLVFRQAAWVLRPGALGYLFMLLVGFVLAVGVEWNALHRTGAWAYAPGMPLVPVVGVGLLPVLQMLLLPPATFLIVRSSRRRGAGL
jgi:hypothetical protein